MRIYKCFKCGKKLDIHTKERTKREILCIECTKEKQREDGKKHFIERLNSRYPTFEYVSGNPNCDGIVLLKCKICGEYIQRNSQCIRGKNNLTCFNCARLETIKRNEIKKYINELEYKYKKEQSKMLFSIKKKIKLNTQYIKHCKKCNKEYYTHNKRKINCYECSNKKKHSNKSLQKLYERDKGICYICNKECKWDDIEIINGNKIAGNLYPSIDHIIPLCKGGNDDWNNLKLAHRICNSYKSLIDVV